MVEKGKIKAYQQLEHSDCGIVCVRIIARYFGKRVGMQRLRDISDMNREGISVADIRNILSKLGIFSYALKLPFVELMKMPLPAILFWNQSHFVVLHKVRHTRKGTRFYICDPSRGKVSLTEEEMRSHWLSSAGRDNAECESSAEAFGVAVLCAPDESFSTEKDGCDDDAAKWGILRLMKETCMANRRHFLAIIALSVLCLVADICMPLLFQKTVDSGIQGRDIGLIWILVASQLLIFVGNFISNQGVDYLLTRLGLKVGLEMMNNYLCRLVARPLDFFDRKVNSDLIQKTEDQNRIRDFMVGMPDTLLLMALNLLVFSGLLVYYHAWIFLFFLVMTTATILWSTLFLKKRKSIDYSYSCCAAENRNNLYELINGVTEIKVNCAQHKKVSAWKQMQSRLIELSKRSYLVQTLMSSGSSVISRSRDLAVTGLCATLIVEGQMSIGVMMTISYLTGRLAGTFGNLTPMMQSLQDTSISLERVKEIHDTEPCPQDELQSTDDLSLKLENVSFKYPGSHTPMVLKGISMDIPQGSTVALVGASGCGKSTLIKLLLNLYVPTEGSISAGGILLEPRFQEAWLSHCGLVSQSGTVFSTSILENIAISDPEPDRERAREVARIACIADFIDSLPMGYDTKLGVAGIELSGGQKQRLFIARALYRNPDILMLDEATSSLDAATEAAIVGNLQRHCKGKTLVIAAHRLSTIRDADRIVCMADGIVTESGTHGELIDLDGDYAALIRRQLTPEQIPSQAI